jgi:hypothetical protein
MRALVHYARAEALLELDPDRALQPLDEAAELGQDQAAGVLLGSYSPTLPSSYASSRRRERTMRSSTSCLSV